MLGQIANYFADNAADWGLAVLQHLSVTASAVLLAAAIALPLGVVSARSKPLRALLTGIFSTLRVIPSLAILFLCVALSWGAGLRAATLALTLLALPPLLINTTLGFAAVPSQSVEVARSMGMTTLQVFFSIKVPLAVPLVLTGLKTAVAEVIASATLAAYVGAGGLGTIIFTGLGLMRSDYLLIGGASVAALTLTSVWLLGVVERCAVPWRFLP
jgi:osmoprotectant transport system permease protein